MVYRVLNPEGIKKLLGKGEANEASTQESESGLLTEYDSLEEEKIKLYRDLPDKGDPLYKIAVKKLHAIQTRQMEMGRFRRAK